MATFNDLIARIGEKPLLPKSSQPEEEDEKVEESPFSDEELLELWKEVKKECLDSRWVFERQWQRNIYYILNRQWIEFHMSDLRWKDKRMAKHIPRPVTNKCKETVQAIRSNVFTSIKLGVNVRPNGQDPENVSTASTCDALSPILHEDHDMNAVMGEFDFWYLACGNALLHSFLDYDIKYGALTITSERCLQCGTVTPSPELVDGTCPVCGGTEFEPAIDPLTKLPMQELKPKGKPVTIALSPLEVAFPNNYSRFADIPYLVRRRWRNKSYYENNPHLEAQVADVSWQRSSGDTAVQLFQSLATQNDLGVSPTYWSDGAAGSDADEGTTEYEVWYKPTMEYPDGLVFRVLENGQTPLILKLPEESLPGPLPYTDAKGNPIFTFAHAAYDQVGGRIWGSGPIDIIIGKQDALNRLDSQIEMIVQRMASPGWSVPKGAGVVKFTGAPGFIMEWNPLTVGGNAKPEQFAGIGIDPSLVNYREQLLKDIEELTGTYDIIKGSKPSGVEAFSAIQALLEQSQARFTGPVQARGDAYRHAVGFQLELERAFGPEERTAAILSPAKTWTFQTFKRAQLTGSVTVIAEDGSNAPKTSLGQRAAVEQAAGLGLLDMNDPDVKYEALRLFGLQKMVPSLDVHVQAAGLKQQEFEEWIGDDAAVQESMGLAQQDEMKYQGELAQHTAMVAAIPPPAPMPQDGQVPAENGQNGPMAPTPALPPPPEQPNPLDHTPLKWRKWYNPVVHRQEFMKWANSDRIRELLKTKPQVEGLLDAHLQVINMALAEEMLGPMGANTPMPAGPESATKTPGGAAMSNSNNESSKGNVPRGTGEGAQNAGPR